MKPLRNSMPVYVSLLAVVMLLAAGLLLLMPSVSSAQTEESALEFNLEPGKQIFSHTEGLVMVLSWLAKKPAKLCLARDLLSQTQVEISRSGRGKLSLQPLVIEDKSKLLDLPAQVLNLQTGQVIKRRVNLKRFHLKGGEHWEAGDYAVKATFNLNDLPFKAGLYNNKSILERCGV